jgi:hypothetical protein
MITNKQTLKIEEGRMLVRMSSVSPKAKLSRLLLLEGDLAQYNSEYKRHSVIEGLTEEIQRLEKEVSMQKYSHPCERMKGSFDEAPLRQSCIPGKSL